MILGLLLYMTRMREAGDSVGVAWQHGSRTGARVESMD